MNLSEKPWVLEPNHGKVGSQNPSNQYPLLAQVLQDCRAILKSSQPNLLRIKLLTDSALLKRDLI